MHARSAARQASLAATLTFAALAAGPAAAQEAPPVVNGITTTDYEQVGVLVACTRDGCWDFCSATYIADGWSLTAAHCVVALDEAVRYYGATPYFGVGGTVDTLDDYKEIVDWTGHPSYSDRTLANDIGMLELDSAFSWLSPMPLRTDSPSSIGSSSFRYVGYGVTSDSRSDSGTKRYGDIPLDSYDDQFIYAYDSSGRVNVCFGDSGGAGMEPVGGGYLLGVVNSFVAPNCVGGYTGGIRVDIYLDWIEGFTATSGGSTGGGSSGGSTGGGSTGGSGGGSTGGSGGGSTGGSTDGSSDGATDGSGDGSGSDGAADGGTGETTDGTGEADVSFGDSEAVEYEDTDKGVGGCSHSGQGAPLALLAFMGALGLSRRREG